MKYVQLWHSALLCLLLASPAPAQPGYGPPENGYPGYPEYPAVEDGYPPAEDGYPLGDSAYAPAYGGMDPNCAADGGWCADTTCTCAGGPCRRHGSMCGLMGRMHRCAATRAYILPLGKRDCSGCPSCDKGPYSDGTCAVHWFDVHAEFMYLKRQEVSRRVDFTSDGIQGPIVLSTDDLSFYEEPGFRVTGTWQIDASSHLEATYFGTFNWHSNAVVTSDTNNLYSVLSDFGTAPADGWLQTDQAVAHFIDYSSDLNNVELNWRRHWVGPKYWCQGSILMGVRYVRLREDFTHITQVDAHIDPNPPPDPPALRGPAGMHYQVSTRNHLVGFQIGSDLFACVLPGLMIGGDLKAGIYGNDARQNTTVFATNLNPELKEIDSNGDVALVAEGGASVIYQITPWLSLRGGYQLLYLNGVALAAENFNTEAPFVGTRPVFINDNGEALYHGFTAGCEWLW